MPTKTIKINVTFYIHAIIILSIMSILLLQNMILNITEASSNTQPIVIQWFNIPQWEEIAFGSFETNQNFT